METVIRKRPSPSDLEKIFDISKAKKKGVDVKKYMGKVKAQGNPVALQRKLRNEW
jgi:hypothetical protein